MCSSMYRVVNTKNSTSKSGARVKGARTRFRVRALSRRDFFARLLPQHVYETLQNHRVAMSAVKGRHLIIIPRDPAPPYSFGRERLLAGECRALAVRGRSGCRSNVLRELSLSPHQLSASPLRITSSTGLQMTVPFG